MDSKGSKTFSLLLILGIVVVYLLLRLPLLSVQNEYVDYDEGTYLMIARLINHGYLPYRDIFAVHPPLYYYSLALWLRVFGDTYISGRLFSLVLGLGSVIIAYIIGSKLRDYKLGVLFSLVVSLDPTTIHINTLVLHDTMIEFFTLLSIWALVEYLHTKHLKFAYASLAIAAIGSATKFTIFPYLISLYTFVIFSTSPRLIEILEKLTKHIITFKQVLIALISYLLWIIVIVILVLLDPSPLIRILGIAPGIHNITKIGHIYTSIAFLFFWLGLTIYTFNIRYLNALRDVLIKIPKILKIGIVSFIIILLTKALIEVPLGFLVSHTYITQTYFQQTTRSYPFIGIFVMMHNVLSTLQSNYPETLVYLVPFFLLLSIIILEKLKNNLNEASSELNILLFLNFVFYFILMPIIPNVRYAYSMFLVLYLALLYPIDVSSKHEFFKILSVIFITLLLVDTGIIINYPKGNLALSMGPHTKELRNNLNDFIVSHNLTTGTYLSINPMNAYYLNLSVVPYMVDTFGLGYLNHKNLVNLTNEYHPTYVIFSTWMFSIMQHSSALFNVYWPLFKYALSHGTLLFGESWKDGERIELFSLHYSKQATSSINLALYNDGLSLYINGTSFLNVSLRYGDNELFQNISVFNVNPSSYILKAQDKTAKVTGRILFKNNTVLFMVPYCYFNLSFNGVAVSLGKHTVIYLHDGRCLTVVGKQLTILNNSIITGDGQIGIKLGCGYHGV
ncbi:ArnT family glycosyltransferase [Thermococcus henrietii]|uniref:ArnT family glycosyltransferase n=1 Tax=Thermococcus henrietii TaxID=2016361 RepID=UPI0013146EF4|nr:glycosyltransferase family 39 protein [Thermococcus henrietii]